MNKFCLQHFEPVVQNKDFVQFSRYTNAKLAADVRMLVSGEQFVAAQTRADRRQQAQTRRDERLVVCVRINLLGTNLLRCGLIEREHLVFGRQLGVATLTKLALLLRVGIKDDVRLI